MNYQESIEYLNKEDKRGPSNNQSILKLLSAFSNPEKKLKYIHITGTNGKGSTALYLTNVLSQTNMRVGLFSSPHIEKINERIRIADSLISDDDFSYYITKVREKIEKEDINDLKYFEIIFIASLLYFVDQNIDLLVLEVGIGGRKDATNVIPSPLAAVFTSIGLDHQSVLGNTIEEVAREKSMIIKSGTKVFSQINPKEAIEILSERAMKTKSNMFLLSENDIDSIKNDSNMLSFTYKNKEYMLKTPAVYAAYNASLAILIINTLFPEIEYETIRQGLLASYWPGRMNVLMDKPLFLIDGAHNENGFESLTKSLELFEYKRLILCVAMMDDKNTGYFYKQLIDQASIVVFTEIDYYRAKHFQKNTETTDDKYFFIDDLEEAAKFAIKSSEDGDLILFTGSLYMTGEILKRFNNDLI